MLGLTNDQLLSRLFSSAHIPRVLALRPGEPDRALWEGQRREMEPQPRPITNREGPVLESDAANQVVEAMQNCVEHIQRLMPGVSVNITLSYGSKK
jgi:hypothetical protein